MNVYSIGLFVHIIGALGFFMALGVEWISLHRLRQAATVEQVQKWMRVTNGIRRIGMISMLALIISGVYMTVTTWGAAAWIIVSIAALILLIVLVLTLTSKPMAAIERTMTAESSPMSSALRLTVRHPILWLVMQMRVAISLGIVFLMTTKPDLAASLLTIGMAVVAGFLVTLPKIRREQARENPVA